MKSRNPILPPDRYFPDGEPHYINGELYVYPSCDDVPGSYCSDRLYVVHSKDLSEWKVDGPAFHRSLLDWEMSAGSPPGLTEAKRYSELPAYLQDAIPKYIRLFLPFRLFRHIVEKNSAKGNSDTSKRMLYAPDSLTTGSRSYLFFCTSDGGEGIAVSDQPAGPFRDPVRITLDQSGKPISGIDPAVFRDDDGKVYLYWGQINSYGAQLTDDLTKVREDTLKQGLLTEKEHCFHEGSSMRKIGDTYYYIFADTHRGKPTALGYATSRSPLGPFEYRGIIIDNAGCDPETWNNHGSIECVNGQWYVFYHRSTNNSRYLRRMCAEPITIGQDGSISEVPITSIGMGEPYKFGEPLYGYQACQVSGNAFISGDKLVVREGRSEVVYRYVDTGGKPVRSVTCESTGEAVLDFSVDEKGELRIRITAGRDIEISSFTMHE